MRKPADSGNAVQFFVFFIFFTKRHESVLQQLRGMTIREGDVFRSVSRWWMSVDVGEGASDREGASIPLVKEGYRLAVVVEVVGGNRYSRLLARLPTSRANATSADITVEHSPTSTTSSENASFQRNPRNRRAKLEFLVRTL